MNEDERTVRGPQIPHGTILANLIASEMPCGKEGCESWRTVGLDIAVIDDTMERYSICLPHLAEFVQVSFFEGEGFLAPDEDCGDEDCPIHGHPEDE